EVFQTTPLSGPNSVGRLVAVETPVPFGPRNRDQSPSLLPIAPVALKLRGKMKAEKISVRIVFVITRLLGKPWVRQRPRVQCSPDDGTRGRVRTQAGFHRFKVSLARRELLSGISADRRSLPVWSAFLVFVRSKSICHR